jgi:hypothetical protein
VHAPQVREPGWINPFARLGRASERLCRLAKVVLQEPGFGERTPELNLLVARKTRASERSDEE